MIDAVLAGSFGGTLVGRLVSSLVSYLVGSFIVEGFLGAR